jgi:hypothetical protein
MPDGLFVEWLWNSGQAPPLAMVCFSKTVRPTALSQETGKTGGPEEARILKVTRRIFSPTPMPSGAHAQFQIKTHRFPHSLLPFSRDRLEVLPPQIRREGYIHFLGAGYRVMQRSLRLPSTQSEL